MSIIIDTWQVETNDTVTEVIIPDGCNDVILKCRKGFAPTWMISSLQDSSQTVELQADSQLFGFRLSPGTQIKQTELLQKLHSVFANQFDAPDIIDEYCSQHHLINEALQNLATAEVSVAKAARDLSLNLRGLQRLIKGQTGKTPLFWIRLAKVRHAARDVIRGMPLGDCAFSNGYADQAHMSREIKLWLGSTPSQLSSQKGIKQQLAAKAYY